VELTAKKYGGRDWRKLLTTRRGTVLVAGACAIVAAGILIFAMQRYRHNVSSEGTPQTVLVASGLIQKGTAGDAIASEQLFKATPVPGKQVSSGAIADTAALQGKVAASDIYPGQQLTAADFTGASGLIGELAPDQRAITITVSSARGMIGEVQAGDRVDVYADLESGSGRSQSFVRLLLANVPVLTAPSGAARTGIGSANAENQQSNVTLKVNASQAGALAFAADNGKIWLVLRPANATSPHASPTVSVSSLASGSIK
jgi:pilus assembly protein CpaB